MQIYKHSQQLRISHKQRLETIKKQTEDFMGSMNKLEEELGKEYTDSIERGLREEMETLQKKILDDMQQAEMQSVRKKINSLFSWLISHRPFIPMEDSPIGRQEGT